MKQDPLRPSRSDASTSPGKQVGEPVQHAGDGSAFAIERFRRFLGDSFFGWFWCGERQPSGGVTCESEVFFSPGFELARDAGLSK